MSPLKHDVGLLRWSYIIFILVAMYEQLPLKHVENNCSQARRSLAGLHARPASPTRSLPFPYQPHTTPEQPWFDPSKKENKPRLRIHHAPVVSNMFFILDHFQLASVGQALLWLIWDLFYYLFDLTELWRFLCVFFCDHMNCKSFCIDIFVVLTACLDHDF